jgi:hypothetical protein
MTFVDGKNASSAANLFQLIISLGTCATCVFFSSASSWTVLTRPIRTFFTDYAATLALILWSLTLKLAQTGNGLQNAHIHIEHLQLPMEFGTTTGRGWFPDLTDISIGHIFYAMIPGFVITVLFYFDHNISALFAQIPNPDDHSKELKKGSYFHLDFFVLGICMFVTGILGIPPCTGMIPQAPLHTKSLRVMRRAKNDLGEYTQEYEVESIVEQRISNFSQSCLYLIFCFRPFSDIIRLIPNAGLYGLFIFLGVESVGGNQLYERFVALLSCDDDVNTIQFRKIFPSYQETEYYSMLKFTAFQLIITLIIYIFTITPMRIIFPVLICILIVIRLWIIPKIFTEAEIARLDPFKFTLIETKDEMISEGVGDYDVTDTDSCEVVDDDDVLPEV